MVSMALGLLIIWALYAGFRSTMQSISLSLALSNENAILRHGFQTVLDEADYWTAYDHPEAALPSGQANPDPTEPLTQGLGNRRTADLSGLTSWGYGRLGVTMRPSGGPFTPFAQMKLLPGDTAATATAYATAADPWTNGEVWKPRRIRSNTVPVPSTTQAAPQEFERGWDADYHWSAADARTWNWANPIEAQFSGRWYDGVLYGDHRYGLYAMFASPFSSVLLAAQTYAPTSSRPSFGTVEPLHHWLPNQVLGLKGSLGDYGLYEYLPSHVKPLFYGVFDAMSNSLATQDMDLFLGLNNYVRAAPAASFYTNFRLDTLPATTFLRHLQAVKTAPGAGNGSMGSNMVSVRNEQQTTGMFLYHTVTRPLYFQKPQKWPDVTCSYFRYIGPAHHGMVATLNWSSLVREEAARIYVTPFGTTLRGARQQRHRDGGWATWLANADELRSKRLEHQTGGSATMWFYRVWTGTPRAAGSRVVGYVIKRPADASAATDEKLDLVADMHLNAGFTIPAGGNDPTLDDY